MQLNTDYWGEGNSTTSSGIFLCPSDFRWAGSGNTTNGTRTFYQLYTNNILSPNEHIDSSIFYCYSWASKLSTYVYVDCTWDNDEDKWIADTTGPSSGGFTNYMFCTSSYNYQRTTNGVYASSVSNPSMNRVGYNVNQIYNTTFTPLIKYATARMRFCCYVNFYRVDSIVDTNDTILNSMSDSYLPLNTFLNDETYLTMYQNDILRVTSLTWKCFITEPNATRGSEFPRITIGTVNEIDEHQILDNWSFKTYIPLNNSFILGQGGRATVLNRNDRSRLNTFLFFNTSNNWRFDFSRATISNENNHYLYAYVPYEKLMDVFHEFAYTGLFYTDSENTAASTNLNDPHLYWGIMSFTGATSGRYGQGSYALSNDEVKAQIDQDNKMLNDDTDPELDPNEKYHGQDSKNDPTVDPNDYINKTDLARPSITSIDVFNRSYAMTATQIRALADWLWNADDDKFTEIIEGMALMGENPMNGLIDCRLYPFAITDMINTTGGQYIKIGRITSDVYGIKLSNAANCVIDLGECKFFEENKNFLDYSPYTVARLYIPYCGWHSIDTAEFMGKTITAKLIVDVITGSCNGIIYADGVIVINASGVIGVEIPMTGTDSATYASQTVSAGLSAVSQIFDAGASVMGGGISGTAGNSLMREASQTTHLADNRLATYNAGKRLNNLDSLSQIGGSGPSGQLLSIADTAWKAHTVPVQYEKSGCATPSCGNWLPQYAYFVIDRPITIEPSNYGHTVGYACCESKSLNNYSGYTVCTNVDTSGFVQATDNERSELKVLLENGVYL